MNKAPEGGNFPNWSQNRTMSANVEKPRCPNCLDKTDFNLIQPLAGQWRCNGCSTMFWPAGKKPPSAGAVNAIG
jgi:ribosomal protein L37AE/L43A